MSEYKKKSMSDTIKKIALSFVTLAMIAGCSEQSGPAPAQTVAKAPTVKLGDIPADPRMADLYQRSCKTCHEATATGAPLTGDLKAWGERMDKGMEALVQSAINGSGAMPPLGLCMECDESDFENLIRFMAGE